MAKKDGKKKDKAASRGDAVRAAVDQAFQATAEQAETARVRASDIVDEFAQAAGRVREVLEELTPARHDEIVELRKAVERLEARLAKVEAAQKKPAARRTTTRKPAARKPAARKPAAPTPPASSDGTAGAETTS
jgi:hypothetical protein